MPNRRVRVGVDTGGTFTDVVAVDEDSGSVVSTKTATTPTDPATGFMAGIEKVLAAMQVDPLSVTAVSHGTTVATNQLLEGRVGRLGFLTTEGYEHVLEIARQSVPDGYGNSYFWVKPGRIVPADMVRTVGGRLAADGTEIRPLVAADAEDAARFFADAGVDSLAVCLLHSYANDEHEHAVLEAIRRILPDVVVSLSSQVLREYREYERSVTTLVDAAVKPGIRRYIGHVTQRLATSTDAQIPFYVMTSNGGVLSAEEVVDQPIRTVLSGPAAGALGAATVAKTAGLTDVVTLDGGGTSTDVTVVTDGTPDLTTEGHVGGYPSKIPMIDVVTVGAGGGSIARLSPEGTLKVGPQSAGAEPGPICYGRGGEDPTVTDAHAVLGRLPPHLLGGEVPLDVPRAREGLRQLAQGLGLSVEDAAAGVLEVSAWNQANALRQITVQRGLDVRSLSLVAFGGSGPLLACRLADILRLSAVVVPPDPGNLSAYGLLTVDVRTDHVQTAVSRHSRLDLQATNRIFDGLRAEAAAALQREGFAEGKRRFECTADLRYFGQAFEVRVEVPDETLTADTVEQVADRFHQAHQALYGYDFRDDPRQEVEWVNLRVTGIGPIRRPATTPASAGQGGGPCDSRPVYFDEWRTAMIYDRGGLGTGDIVTGPAIVEEYSSTVPIHPGFRARVDEHRNLTISAQG